MEGENELFWLNEAELLTRLAIDAERLELLRSQKIPQAA
jgi:hypothetical protein